MHANAKDFKQNAHRALNDAFLQGAIRKATQRFVNERTHAVAERPDFEALRERGRAIKQEALDRLPDLLQEFEDNVISSGGQVHWARDAEEAQQIIVRIARNAGVKTIVKSKSMTTEEIGLNPVLEREGFVPVETDLGEYILQLDDDYPSHIIAPAVHKTKEDVANIFERRLHVKNPPEAGIPGLNAIARKALRGNFLKAEMGLTGANLACAETGTIVLVENEGNICLTTALPRIHVALVGIEKVVPRFDDLSTMLMLLPRSATGQRLGSYTSFITGIAKNGEEGPEQFHVVLLDNGRSRIYADEHLRGSLRCIRCGACLNACPVYNRTGGHAYGWVYPGPIGAVITPQYLGLAEAPELPYASSLCGACYEVCPVKIEIPHMLLELRGQVAQGTAQRAPVKRPFLEALSFRAFAFAAQRPALWRLLSGIGRRVLRSKASGATIPSVPLPVLQDWTRDRDLPTPPADGFLEQWRTRRGNKGDDA
ncbi:MAG: LutB/LldF family L-lactate oxidation iron-sulfur protein [Planctomycetes bacterium]|nr:LutB/LldF family L-lactate oxidation iron-sulfur protein [Planctomycetota bacterium]